MNLTEQGRQDMWQGTIDNERDKVRIGISACLLGHAVRFDGQGKRDAYLTDVFTKFAEFIPVCPEVDIGMGIPRETIRLVRSDSGPRLVGPKSGTDYTARMTEYASGKTNELERLDLNGYIFKKGSPTCGLHRVKIYDHNNCPSGSGRGLFADSLKRRIPLLPMEEEGRLNDPRLRENFIKRVYAYRRARNLFSSRWTTGDLVRFHTGEKYLILAHDPGAYRRLGRLVASAANMPREEVTERYQGEFLGALEKIPSTNKHVNVLSHMTGFLKKMLDPAQRAELNGLIEDFSKALVPIIVPITLLQHFVRRFRVKYLEHQVYLQPYPKELMLRNYV